MCEFVCFFAYKSLSMRIKKYATDVLFRLYFHLYVHKLIISAFPFTVAVLACTCSSFSAFAIFYCFYIHGKSAVCQCKMYFCGWHQPVSHYQQLILDKYLSKLIIYCFCYSVKLKRTSFGEVSLNFDVVSHCFCATHTSSTHTHTLVSNRILP